MPIRRERLQCNVMIKRGNLSGTFAFLLLVVTLVSRLNRTLISITWLANNFRRIYYRGRFTDIFDRSMSSRWDFQSVAIKTDESGWAFLSKNMGGYGKISIDRWYYSPSGAANQLTTTKNTCEGQTPYSNTGYIGHVREWVLLRTCSVCCWQYVDFSQLVCSGHQIHRSEAGGFCHTFTIIWSPNAMR